MIKKIISGGQTGVDRAALDVAMRLGIPVGGWCPHGRWSEDGPIADQYPLMETDSSDPADRTILNIETSDGTLVIAPDIDSPGTTFTIDETRRLGKPLLLCNPVDPAAVDTAQEWIAREGIEILNVAGPRASEHSGIYGFAARFLLGLLLRLLVGELSLSTGEQSD